MTAFLRRRRGPAPAAPRGIGVVDGTGYDIGAFLCHAMTRDGLPAHEIEPFDLAADLACAVVLLPAAPGVPALATQHALSVIGALGADPARVRTFRTPLVLAWHVIHPDRLRIAARHDDRSIHNSAELLVGTSWPRELRRHAGEPRAAAHCRSDQVARLVRAAARRDLGVRGVPELCASAHRLDPMFLHALMVQVPETDAAQQIRHHWTGASSVAAAVLARIG